MIGLVDNRAPSLAAARNPTVVRPTNAAAHLMARKLSREQRRRLAHALASLLRASVVDVSDENQDQRAA